MANEKARIALAEAMGGQISDDGSLVFWQSTSMPVNWDPFMSANDDYAVLEWMRERCHYNQDMNMATKWIECKNELLEVRQIHYKIGNWAEICLKYIDQ